MIPESFIQELLARVDIVDVVERYVPLRKAGANFSACCPFHSEKTPSFTVSPSKQFYHCFGCGAHGSAIGFVMQYSGLGFIDAVEDLASHIGLQVPRVASVHGAAESSRKAPLTELMARAAKYFREQLKQSSKAIDYLKGRGLTGEIAARFGLGYAPDDWQSLKAVFTDYADPALAECGLVIDSDSGRRYDRFRDRIMFPIFDQRNNVIAFGGRVIGAGEPKYLNSPETPLFEKGRELYGLPQARRAVHDSGTVIVVEGYMDVVGLAQFGVENVVATLGTAATSANAQRLSKLCDRVVYCFDRDSAGDRAARRATENSLEFLADGKRIEILQLDGDQDPDEYIREHGKEAFLRQLGQATPLSQYLVREIRKGLNLATAEDRAKLIQEAKPLLQRIAAPVLRAQLTKEIAGLAQLSQAEVESQCGLKPLARNRAPQASRVRVSARPLENTLLKIVLQRPEWSMRIPIDLVSGELAEGRAIRTLVHAIEQGDAIGAGLGSILEHFRTLPEEDVIASAIKELADEEPDIATLEQVFEDSIGNLQRLNMEREIDARKHQLTADEWRQLLARKSMGQNRDT